MGEWKGMSGEGRGRRHRGCSYFFWEGFQVSIRGGGKGMERRDTGVYNVHEGEGWRRGWGWGGGDVDVKG